MSPARSLLTLALLVLSLSLVACGGDDKGEGTESAAAPAATAEPEAAEAPAKTKPKIAKPKGAPPKELRIEDLEEGTGTEAKAGDLVTVQYVGVSWSTGEEFDASWDRGEPFQFTLGAGEVIPGWDRGVAGMKEGGRRRLEIPSELAYGPQGSPPAIGPDETLVFVIDLEQVG